jgi:hypothetical protein
MHHKYHHDSTTTTTPVATLGRSVLRDLLLLRLGQASVMSHYYEEGNVQMHNLKDFPATKIDTSDAAAIASHIEKVRPHASRDSVCWRVVSCAARRGRAPLVCWPVPRVLGSSDALTPCTFAH